MRNLRNFLNNDGMSEETIDKILHFHPVIIPKEFGLIQFIAETVYKFNHESDEYIVEYGPMYSNEDWPWYMAGFFIQTKKKDTGDICLSRPLQFDYVEHLWKMKDTESLADYFINGKILYDWEYIDGYGERKFGEKIK